MIASSGIQISREEDEVILRQHNYLSQRAHEQIVTDYFYNLSFFFHSFPFLSLLIFLDNVNHFQGACYIIFLQSRYTS
jgi:hypothetical protein